MDQINQIWPKWHTVELIGRGAFGEVYKAKREEMGAVFYSAVKVISIPHDETEIREMFDEGHTSQSIRCYYESVAKDLMNEINVLEILKSAGNIVNIEEFEIREKTEEIGWEVYIRMELLKNLNKYRQEKNLGCEDVAKLGMDICRALQYCEQSHIIHRDIKPSNIFVDVYGNYKLGDFGIARQMERTQSALSRKGTELYMAPEVRYGDRKSSYNVDIYSLGLVMYRLLNKNRMPFEPLNKEMLTYQDKEDALTKRMQGDALPFPADAPEKLGRIVLKACEADKRLRYQSAVQMYEDLEHWMRGDSGKTDHGSRSTRSADNAESQTKNKAENEKNRTHSYTDAFQNEETVSGFKERKKQSDSDPNAGTRGTEEERKREKEEPRPVKGEDLTIQQFIDEKTARQGGKIRTTAGNGKRLEVTVPPDFRDGQRIRLKGCGKPGKNGGESGDLYIVIKILYQNVKDGQSGSGSQNTGASYPRKTGRKYMNRFTWFLVFIEVSLIFGVFSTDLITAFTDLSSVIADMSLLNEYRYMDSAYSALMFAAILPSVVLGIISWRTGPGKELQLSIAWAVIWAVYVICDTLDVFFCRKTNLLELVVLCAAGMLWMIASDVYLRNRAEKEIIDSDRKGEKAAFWMCVCLGVSIVAEIYMTGRTFNITSVTLFLNDMGNILQIISACALVSSLAGLAIAIMLRIGKKIKYQIGIQICWWVQWCMLTVMLLVSAYVLDSLPLFISGMLLSVGYAAFIEYSFWMIAEN